MGTTLPNLYISYADKKDLGCLVMIVMSHAVNSEKGSARLKVLRLRALSEVS